MSSAEAEKYGDDARDYERGDGEHTAGLLASGQKPSGRRWASRWRSWRSYVLFTIFALVAFSVWNANSAPSVPEYHYSVNGQLSPQEEAKLHPQGSHAVGSSMDKILKPLIPERFRPSPASSSSPSSDKPATEQRPSLHYEPYIDCFTMNSSVITALQSVTEPTVRFVSNGTVLKDGAVLKAPAGLCVLISLPQEVLDADKYFDIPVPGKGPDVVHAYLNASNEIITFPPLNPFPTQLEAYEQSTNISLVYYASSRVMNAGTYELIGEREWAHWRWAQEWAADWNTDKTFTVHTLNGQSYTHKNIPPGFVKIPLPKASITVEGPDKLPPRPACDDTLTPGQGRWYKASDYPDLDVDPNYVDEFGYTWQGDQCHMDIFTPGEAMTCLQDKVVHVYGDSMIRRLAKAIINGGKWCLDPKARCQDEDDDADIPVPKLELDKSGTLVSSEIKREGLFQQNDLTKISFGKNSSMYFSFLTVITNSTGLWMDRLYDPDDLISLKYGGPEHDPTNTHDREVKPGALAREPPDVPNADLVVLGPGAWDQAFTARFDAFEYKLRQLKYAFLHAYGDTPMILRLSNMYCCRETTNGRRYNGGRVREFDERTRRVFEANAEGSKASNNRIMLLDPANMNGRPDIINDIKVSHANHPRASHVRTEFQMMMNSICKRDPDTGVVSFRHDQKR